MISRRGAGVAENFIVFLFLSQMPLRTLRPGEKFYVFSSPGRKGRQETKNVKGCRFLFQV
jgi:hypothetical protein